MRLFLSCDWSLSHSSSGRFTRTKMYKSRDIFFQFHHSIFVHLLIQVLYPHQFKKVKMPGLLNSESRQVTIAESRSLRVTFHNFSADDSTSAPNNNTADDLTSALNNNTADDLTSPPTTTLLMIQQQSPATTPLMI